MSVSCVPAPAPAPESGMAAQSIRSLEPYILIGESGKSVDRTASDIIARLFFRNFQILGKYQPGGDPNRYVIVVTDPNLLAVAGGPKVTAGFLAAWRIAITGDGDLTYVVCQEPEYWANAYLQDDYPAVAEKMGLFRDRLLQAMPAMRGRFMRPYGGDPANPLTPADLRTFQFNGRAESLEDLVTLAVLDSFDEALVALEDGIARTSEIVFKVAIPGKQAWLYGVSLAGEFGDREILHLLETDDLRHTGSLPYEILVTGNTIMVLPVSYRLPLYSPGMARDTFSSLVEVQEEITRILSAGM